MGLGGPNRRLISLVTSDPWRYEHHNDWGERFCGAKFVSLQAGTQLNQTSTGGEKIARTPKQIVTLFRPKVVGNYTYFSKSVSPIGFFFVSVVTFAPFSLNISNYDSKTPFQFSEDIPLKDLCRSHSQHQLTKFDPHCLLAWFIGHSSAWTWRRIMKLVE